MSIADKLTDQFFLSCDWGTTCFRLKIVDFESGKTIAGIEDQEGIKKINDRWTKYNGKLNRSDFFLSSLRKKISHLEMRSSKETVGFPIVISGMASSSIGIKELPYATLPVLLSDPDLYIEKIKASDHFPHNLYLISGLKKHDDIMRGEETQLIGLADKYEVKNGTYILPGTHSKHIYIKNKTINDFKTYLTGELFELLIFESILANSVNKSPGFGNKDAFHRGIDASQELNFLNAFFKIRASDILRESDPESNFEYLSGLLIGSELSDLSKADPEQIIIAGTKQLQDYYSTACDYMKLNYFETDSSIDITVWGHRKILNKIRNQK